TVVAGGDHRTIRAERVQLRLSLSRSPVSWIEYFQVMCEQNPLCLFTAMEKRGAGLQAQTIHNPNTGFPICRKAFIQVKINAHGTREQLENPAVEHTSTGLPVMDRRHQSAYFCQCGV